jgi:hypothetical protein
MASNKEGRLTGFGKDLKSTLDYPNCQTTMNDEIICDQPVSTPSPEPEVSLFAEALHGQYTYLTYAFISAACFGMWLVPSMRSKTSKKERKSSTDSKRKRTEKKEE